MNFDGLISKFNPKVRTIVSIITNLIVIAFLIVLTKYGIEVAKTVFNDRLTSIPVSRGVVISVIPISGVIMLLALVNRIYDYIVMILKGTYSDYYNEKGGEE